MLVTFDVYMALVDIQGSLEPQVAKAFGLEPSRAGALVARWRARQMERAASSNSLGLGHLPFTTCTELGLRNACAAFGVEPSATDVEHLVDAWGHLDPWPEADQALAAVRARGHALAILSNGDQATLESIANRFTTPFDHVLSAETAGAYKPHPAVYAMPEQQLRVAPEDTVHVAGSANDVMGAGAAGLRCIWSNRHGDALVDPGWPPAATVASLVEVVDHL